MVNRTLQKQLFQAGCLLAGLAIILGAFGTHVLKDNISESNLEVFEVGVRYQFYHAIAILFLSVALRKLYEETTVQVFRLWLAGIFVFSGSLYVLATRGLWAGDTIKWVGGITPIGGLALIAGWLWLAYNGYKITQTAEEVHEKRRKRMERKVTETQSEK